jgi:hypothetical protein|tara:strand:+ start:150 stop:296 length:147 start_codon:yes stop_codon:yes gene_type:complete
MSNYEIIKEIYKLAEVDKSVGYWDREEDCEERCEKILALIKKMRPHIR